MNHRTEQENSVALPGLFGRGAHGFIIITILLCMTCLFAACSAASDFPAADTVISTELPSVAEDPEKETAAQKLFSFHTTDLDGNPVDESVFDKYDLVMLNFWAYWCPPCIQEIPELEKLHQEYPNVLLLGVIVDDSDMEETRAILENAGATYPVLFPEGDLATLAAKCEYVPTTFFLKPNGMLAGEPVIGSSDYNGWKKTLEGLLH